MVTRDDVQSRGQGGTSNDQTYSTIFFQYKAGQQLSINYKIGQCVLIPKQHLVMGMLFANILIGPAYPVRFVTRISIISTFTCL